MRGQWQEVGMMRLEVPSTSVFMKSPSSSTLIMDCSLTEEGFTERSMKLMTIYQHLATCYATMLHVLYASKNELARSCKIVQESCKNLDARLAWHVHRRDMSLFLHDSCTILHQFLQDRARNAGNYSCSNSCKILHHFLPDCARIVQEKGHIACTCQVSLACKILARFLQVRFCWVASYTPIRNTKITIPARTSCPPSWTMEFYGYYCNMSGYFKDLVHVQCVWMLIQNQFQEVPAMMLNP